MSRGTYLRLALKGVDAGFAYIIIDGVEQIMLTCDRRIHHKVNEDERSIVHSRACVDSDAFQSVYSIGSRWRR